MTSPPRPEHAPGDRCTGCCGRSRASGSSARRPSRRFSSTPLAERLQRTPRSTVARLGCIRRAAADWQAWGDLLHSVRTGENAFRHVHGVDVWEYRARDPEESAVLRSRDDRITRSVNRSLLDAYDFGRFSRSSTSAGVRGALLAGLLEAYPDDARCPVRPAARRRGRAADLARRSTERLEVVGGSFFEAVPAAGDAYLLKAIIHDWEDPEALRILERLPPRCAAWRIVLSSSGSSASRTQSRTPSSAI